MIGDTAPSPDTDTVTDPRSLTGDTIVTGGGAILLRARTPEVSHRSLTDAASDLRLRMATRGGGIRTGTQLSRKGESLEIDLGIGKETVAVESGRLTGTDLPGIAVSRGLLLTETGLGLQEAETDLRGLTDPEQGRDQGLLKGQTDLGRKTMPSKTPLCLLK